MGKKSIKKKSWKIFILIGLSKQKQVNDLINYAIGKCSVYEIGFFLIKLIFMASYSYNAVLSYS